MKCTLAVASDRFGGRFFLHDVVTRAFSHRYILSRSCMKLHGTNTSKVSTCFLSVQPRKTTFSTTQRSSLHVASLSSGNVLWTSWRTWQTLRRDGSSLSMQIVGEFQGTTNTQWVQIQLQLNWSFCWFLFKSFIANHVPGHCEWRDLQCCKEGVRADAAKETQFQWSLDGGVWVVAAHAHVGDRNASRPCCGLGKKLILDRNGRMYESKDNCRKHVLSCFIILIYLDSCLVSVALPGICFGMQRLHPHEECL